jgi:hypothetical protein
MPADNRLFELTLHLTAAQRDQLQREAWLAAMPLAQYARARLGLMPRICRVCARVGDLVIHCPECDAFLHGSVNRDQWESVGLLFPEPPEQKP